MLAERPAAARARVAERARELLDGGCVVLDTETTGLGADARICDLAVIDAGGVILLDTPIYPGVPIPEAATAVHGITDRDVQLAPSLLVAWHRLMVAIAGRVVVAYNAEYDRRVLARHARAYNLAPPAEPPWTCAMLLAAEAHGSGKWLKLDAACKANGVALDGAHRALADARATWELLRALADGGA